MRFIRSTKLPTSWKRRLLKSRALLVLSILVMLAPVSVGGTRPRPIAGCNCLSGYVVHGAISISGNADFASQSNSEGWSGNGSPFDPYVIENLSIVNQLGCIYISQVSVSFVIHQCNLTTNGLENCSCVILDNVSDGIIQHCLVDSNGPGIDFRFVHNCTLDSNTIVGCRDALRLTSSCNCTFANNVFADGGVAFGSTEKAGFCHVFSNNTVMGRPLGYFWNVTVNLLDTWTLGQLIVVGSSGSTIKYGQFSGTSCCALFVSCRDCYLVDVNAYSATVGMILFDCNRISVLGGHFYSNAQTGLSIDHSSNCQLTYISAYYNGWSGIDILGSNISLNENHIGENHDGVRALGTVEGVQTSGGYIWGNLVSQNSNYGVVLESGTSSYLLVGNTFDSNGINAWDDGVGNSWDDPNGYGNYWSDYSGSGVYQIGGSASSVDHYPSITISTGTTVTNGPIVDSGIALFVWFFLSVAVVSIPTFLMTRSKWS